MIAHPRDPALLSFKNNHKRQGFGLIEVLIAVVILSIGLLGLASLQNRSIQSLQEGDNLVTAAMIAKEMAQRMMSNRYMLAQGRQGYLATDLNGDIATAGSVTAWADAKETANPDVARCYSADNTESCFAAGATLSNSSDHITALTNMQILDEIEMRRLAWNLLPEGEINLCFDATGATTTWACDDTATRITARKENVFTVKVRWNNIFSNDTQMYALQFTAECTDDDPAFCGN